MRNYCRLIFSLLIFGPTILGTSAPVAASAKPASPNLTVSTATEAGAHCVSDDIWSDWRGEIDYRRCCEALTLLRARVPQDHAYLFWSGRDSDRPPPTIPRPWRLPNHADAGKQSYSTCKLSIVIFARM